jgi:endonuclease YncB( thermonuclease family)
MTGRTGCMNGSGPPRLVAALACAQVSGVATVSDGDTIEMHGRAIRLHGVDAPEGHQLCQLDGTPWRCGQAAANALADRLGKRTVARRQRDRDRYDRPVSVCTVGGEDVNAWLVREGWALAYRKYSSDYVPEEVAARAARRGHLAKYVSNRLGSGGHDRGPPRRCPPPPGPERARSKAMSTARNSASTTCPATATTRRLELTRRAASGGSSRRTRRAVVLLGGRGARRGLAAAAVRQMSACSGMLRPIVLDFAGAKRVFRWGT